MVNIYSDYDNYRWIDYNRWSNSREVDVLVAQLVKDMNIRKNSGYRINMKVVVMDLYQSYLTDREQYIAFYRKKDHYLNAGDDHPYIKNPNISHAYFIGCVNHLRLDFIEYRKGGQFYNEELGEFFSYVSRMRATDKLVRLWEQYKITPEMITKYKPDELIRLKGPKVDSEPYLYKGKMKTKKIKPPMKCPDTPAVRKMYKLIERYNNLLERTDIDVDVECMTSRDRNELVERLTDMDTKNKRFILRLANKSVYRVFNNGILQNGGRFYGAWWIGAPSTVRKYITINGKPTRELDYSGIHIHILYALKGINYAELKEDAYALDGGLSDRKLDRKLNKLILLTAFNADGPESTAKAVFDELRNEGLLYKCNLHSHQLIYDKLKLLKIKHATIADKIAHDFGSQLQYYDSCIIEKLIDHFTKKRIPILTVHDSVICESKYSEFIRDKMWELYSNTIHELLKCNIKYTSLNPYAGYALNLINRKHGYNANDGLTNILCKLNCDSKYKGKLPMVNNNIISIKQEKQRANKCNLKCNHHTRISTKVKYKPTIKLELIEHTGNYTNTLLIR